MIPAIDVAPLFGPDSNARRASDAAIVKAAADSGFLTLHNFPDPEVLTAAFREKLLAIFHLPEASKAKLLRRGFDPSRPNVYRGWYPLQPGQISYKDGIDMGPDVAHGARDGDPSDPLCEATPFPEEAELPGWRAAAARYYLVLEEIGQVLNRAIARGLGMPENIFEAAFRDGNSTLRLSHYPGRDPVSFGGRDPARFQTEFNGKTHWRLGVEHCDSGCVTLLAQNGVEGLQARLPDGAWVTVPPTDGTLAVNFGKLLERWTGGRIRATEHRVLALGGERYSVPFFYEPRVDALIEPLPLEGVPPFEPFLYGDHLWAATTQFVEQKGIAHLRQPRGTGAQLAL